MVKRIGVLNVQGAVSEHIHHVEKAGGEAVPIKYPADLAHVSGLVIPGGESTTIGRLMRQYGLMDPIRERIADGMPVFGTCAGLILLAQRIEGQADCHLGVMDMTVNRNSFGRQIDSFEADLAIEGVEGDPFPSVFIRAPHIVEAGPDVKVLSMYKDKIVAARQDHMLVTAFHPELTDDVRMHQLFVDMV